MNKVEIIQACTEMYSNEKLSFEMFKTAVETFFNKNPRLNQSPLPIIHSIKSRMKDPNHLSEKIERKINAGRTITPDSFFKEITDLIGVRVLHLYPGQFPDIHSEIIRKVDDGDWHLNEKPVAYSWDPESKEIFDKLSIETTIKDSYYTSIHYVIKPKEVSNVCCEIQVRTLFEEIWGEIDHTINYPRRTQFLASQEQLRVLAKLVSTGTRMVDSIFRIDEEMRRTRPE